MATVGETKLLVPKCHRKAKPLESGSRRARRIEEAELRRVEAEAKRAEGRVQNEGRREELAVEREEIALDSDRLERRRGRIGLAREFAGRVKDAAATALSLVMAVVLVVAALKGLAVDTALTILGVLVGRRGISTLRGGSGS